MRKTAVAAVVVLILAICLYGCTKTEPQRISESTVSALPEVSAINSAAEPTSSEMVQPPASLKGWLGYYKFYEEKTFDDMLLYNISIYEESGAYVAHFEILGLHPVNEFLAFLDGDNSSIDLVFEKYVGKNASEPYKKGDVLLTLKKEQDVLVTSWGSLQPLLKENEPAGEHIKKMANANESWTDIENKDVKILQDTILVNELDSNDKKLFYLGMTRDVLMSILLDNDIYYYSMESDPGEGSSTPDNRCLYYFLLYQDTIGVHVDQDTVDYIEIRGTIPIKATSTQAGLNLGDTFDKMVELYGDDYAVRTSSITGEEMFKIYEYKMGSYHFNVYFLNDTVARWEISIY